MKALQEFSSKLEALIGRPSTLRPFVCEGSPLECSIMIVGANAATEMTEDFWEYWDRTTGFNKSRWFNAYVEQRRTAPLKPGKTRRPDVSPTRRVLGAIQEGAAPATILETNVYSRPSADLANLVSQDRQTAVFDFLLTSVRPSTIVAHGKDAAHHLRAAHPNLAFRQTSHFSRGWSDEAARKLGAELLITSRKP